MLFRLERFHDVSWAGVSSIDRAGHCGETMHRLTSPLEDLQEYGRITARDVFQQIVREVDRLN